MSAATATATTSSGPTPTHSSVGTHPLYASLYRSKDFISPSFYLPDPVAPLPISPRPSENDFAQLFVAAAARRRRRTRRGASASGSTVRQRAAQLHEEEEEEQEEMLPPVILLQTRQEQDRKSHQTKTAKVVGKFITVENLLPALRNQDPSAAPDDDDEEEKPEEASWARALLSYLHRNSFSTNEGTTTTTTTVTTLLQVFRSALQECENSVGLDLIKLSWSFATAPAHAHVGDHYVARRFEKGGEVRMGEEERIRCIEEVLEREDRIIVRPR